jgi:8-oxo-dGTP pyrophosphatase MutT (NUDIX family)
MSEAVRRECRAWAQQVRADLVDRWGSVPRRERRVALPHDPPASADDVFPWATVCLVVDDDRVCYLRDDSHGWQNWEPPGGKGEPPERPAETAARETREEVGLDVVVEDLLAVETLRFDYGDGGTYDVAQGVFEAARDGGETRAREADIAAVRWFPRDDLPETAQYRGLLDPAVDGFGPE